MTLLSTTRKLALAAALALVPAAALALGATESQALKAVSAKFQTVSSMSGDFVQFGPSGDKTEGRFFMARPGKINFTYSAPATISVVSDGNSVLVHDKKLQTYDIWPLSKTPLKYLLQQKLDLSTFDKVSDVTLEADLVSVTIVDDSRFGGGKLTLIFDRATNELRQWSVIDDQGLQTSVSIYNVETGKRLAGDLFKINYSAATNAARERSR
ncbi:LolA family protein [Faunimonas sp. B44]|uniref:LolA family protein n=1 Tax=Faunimonas sp. B44 TaxID=3461493 RepID=UPI004043AB21